MKLFSIHKLMRAWISGFTGAGASTHSEISGVINKARKDQRRKTANKIERYRERSGDA